MGMIGQKDRKDLIDAYTVAINGERVTLGLPTSVERKEVTGRNGKDLFIEDNYDEFLGLLAETLTAIDDRGKHTDSKSSVGKS